MSDSTSLRDRYLELIDQIVDTTLKGNIRSKEQVYQMLLRGISSGTGEIFERCLDERIRATEAQLEVKIKAARILRALQTIEKEWERWQKENQVKDAIALSVQQILNADQDNRLLAFVQIIDPNQKQVLSIEQLKQLAQALKGEEELQPLATGITRSLQSFAAIEDYLISWIVQQERGSLGFGGDRSGTGPWTVWAKQISSPLPQQLFHTLAENGSITQFASQQRNLDPSAWVELVLLLRYIQQGLVAWFDKQPYDAKAGKKLSTSTFLTFAVIWGQLATGFASYQELANSSFQIMLQVLRSFSQREDFPLYGGIFASFSGEYLRDTLNYLDQPLRQVEGTQEKARILTLLGYSMRALGQYDRSIAFHTEALEIARTAGDRPCEIANLNHLSRTCVAQKDYTGAINYSQRALILARQTGDRLGEANALANLGYSEVFSARQLDRIEPEIYETAISYLQQALQLSERLHDRQSQALCYNSLGIAHVILEQPAEAIAYLEKGISAAQFSGDLYLQALNFAYLGQAYYSMNHWDNAVSTGSLGMYLLHQISSTEWRQPAGLLIILQGQLGVEAYQKLLEQQRSKIIAFIGVDGYDYLPQLLEEYKRSRS